MDRDITLSELKALVANSVLPRLAALERAGAEKDATIERLQAEVLSLQRKLYFDGVWVQDKQLVWSLHKVSLPPHIDCRTGRALTACPCRALLVDFPKRSGI